jgi:hypothetical protein
MPANGVPGLGDDADGQRARLRGLREQLLAERAAAVSPAVERALEQADVYLFLGLTYLGETDELFPGEKRQPPGRNIVDSSVDRIPPGS